jgi:chitodextrinase
VKQRRALGSVAFSVLAVSAMLVAVPAAAHATTTARNTALSGPAAAGRAQTYWFHLDSGPISDETIAVEAPRRSFVVLNAWDYPDIPKFKAINPDITMLVYKDLSSTVDYGCTDGVDLGELPTGVGYCYAAQNHPEWFLTDSSGTDLHYAGYQGTWQMDVGNPDYQQAWIGNVLSDATANGWDGIAVDNALVACDAYHADVCPAGYPSDQSIQAAYLSFLSAVHSAAHARGLEVMGNLAGARTHPGVWNSYLDQLDGGFDEFWLVNDTTSQLPDYGDPSIGWKAQLDEIAYAEQRGKSVAVQPHSDESDPVGFYYALASYFLVNQGGAAISEPAANGYQDPGPWRDAYTWDLGVPQGGYYSTSAGVYRRDFSCGAVAVDANATGTTTVDLGAPYLDENSATVSSVTLAATTGTVLRRLSCNDVTAPTVPATVAALQSGPGSIAVTWDASSDDVGVTGYLVYRDGIEVAVVDAATTSFTDSGLTDATTYSYAVSAFDGTGNTSATRDSPGVTLPDATPDVTAPTVPKGLRTPTVTRVAATLRWIAATDDVAVTRYDIYRNGTMVGSTTTNQYSDTGLRNGTSYSYVVVACDAAGNCSPGSLPATALTAPDTLAPTAPTNVVATAPVPRQIGITWTPAVDNAGGSGVAGYLVYRSDAPAVVLATVCGATSFVDTTVKGKHTYRYRVIAVDGAGNRGRAGTSNSVIAASIPR